MPETTKSKIVGRGLGKDVALITDSRFSRSYSWDCDWSRLAEGGNIALIEDGDEIVIDLPNRTIDLLVDDALQNNETIQSKSPAVGCVVIHCQIGQAEP